MIRQLPEKLNILTDVLIQSLLERYHRKLD